MVEIQKVKKVISDKITSVVFSPSVYRVASGSNDQTLRVWDIDHVTELLHYQNQTDSPVVIFIMTA